jgi:divalent metal cation (Fe/Co/Zn/Cd) transporter
LIAAEQGLSIHHLVVQDVEGKLAVSFDVEMAGETSLYDAHEEATRLEAAIREGLGGDVEVESHIEPQTLPLVAGHVAPEKIVASIERSLKTLAKAEKAMHDVHSVRVRQVGDGLYVHYHCRFAPDAQIVKVHEIVDRVENRLLDLRPNVKRVVAHTEPMGRMKHRL